MASFFRLRSLGKPRLPARKLIQAEIVTTDFLHCPLHLGHLKGLGPCLRRGVRKPLTDGGCMHLEKQYRLREQAEF